jgi:hypothetical protein
MTNQNKLIVGAVVVLGAYYLYDRNKKMKAVADLKAGAEVKAEEVPVQKNDAKSLLENRVSADLRADNIKLLGDRNNFIKKM